MDTLLIRQAIASARAHERDTRQLHGLLQQRMLSLHRSIYLPARESVQSLVDFICSYVDHVPEFLETIQKVALKVQISDYTDPIVNTCVEFFAHPPEMLSGHVGLNALMDESYLAHRLVEEVNDRFIAHCRVPLIPMDMTRSNLIVHHLIGETFANQLDQAIQLMVDHLAEQELLLASTPVTSAVQFTRAWQPWKDRLPCLTDSLAISLLMNRTAAVH